MYVYVQKLTEILSTGISVRHFVSLVHNSAQDVHNLGEHGVLVLDTVSLVNYHCAGRATGGPQAQRLALP